MKHTCGEPRATLDAAGFAVGGERISVLVALPERVRERVLDDVKSGEGVPVVHGQERTS